MFWKAIDFLWGFIYAFIVVDTVARYPEVLDDEEEEVCIYGRD